MDPARYYLCSRVISTTGPVQDVHTPEEQTLSCGAKVPAGHALAWPRALSEIGMELGSISSAAGPETEVVSGEKTLIADTPAHPTRPRLGMSETPSPPVLMPITTAPIRDVAIQSLSRSLNAVGTNLTYTTSAHPATSGSHTANLTDAADFRSSSHR